MKFGTRIRMDPTHIVLS